MKAEILFEDTCLIVVHKPSGLATQTSKIGQPDLVSEVKNYLAEKQKNPYAAVINRLDQPVEGIVLFAKNECIAKELSQQIQKHQMRKCYYALIVGTPEKQEAILENYMVKDAKTNLSCIVKDNTQKDAKYAKLQYKVLRTVENSFEKEESGVKLPINLVDIALETGRHHQIRVQMAHIGMPLLGDTKYGTKESMEVSRKQHQRNIALCAYRLVFTHPETQKPMDLQIEPAFHIQ